MRNIIQKFSKPKTAATIGLLLLIVGGSALSLQAFDILQEQESPRCIGGGEFSRQKMLDGSELLIFSCKNPKFTIPCDMGTIERLEKKWKCRSVQGDRFEFEGLFDGSSYIKKRLGIL